MPITSQNVAALARVLCDYLEANPRHDAFGFGRDRPGRPGNGSPQVRAFQEAVGITADGVMGPETRGEGKKLGVIFPRRPGASAPGDRLMPKTDETHDIESITFEIAFKSGRVQRAEFIRPEKTLDLLRDSGSLGDFLRGLVKRGTD